MPIHKIPAAAFRQAPLHQSIERLNGESERHAEVVGTILLAQSEWALQTATAAA